MTHGEHLIVPLHITYLCYVVSSSPKKSRARAVRALRRLCFPEAEF